VLALTLILLLGSSVAVQIAWAFRSAPQRSQWRLPFFASVGVAVVVASFDIYVITSSIVSDWKLERRARSWRVEDAISCEQGDGAACLKLAMLWMWGTGGPIDVRKATGFAERGCSMGNKYACDFATEIAADGGPEQYYYRRRLQWPPTNS